MYGVPKDYVNAKNNIKLTLEDSSLKKVLVLGSGMLIEPLIDYLLQDEKNVILLSSNEPLKLKELFEKKNKNKTNYRLYIFELEISLDNKKLYNVNYDQDILDSEFNDEINQEKVRKNNLTDELKEDELLSYLIKVSSLVIPFIPSILHTKIALYCIKHKVNMITSNLINEDLKALENDFVNNDIVLIPELGFQPGLDHLLCTKVINELSKEEKEVTSIEIWCGCLPSPECLDNPLMHKFVFSPKQNIDYLNSDTRQLINGKIVRISKLKNYDISHSLLENRKFHPSLNLEGIFCHDALEFKEKHHLNNCDTVILGVLRYNGYHLMIQCFKLLGLISEEKIIYQNKFKDWRTFISVEILKNQVSTNKQEIENKDSFLMNRVEFFDQEDLENNQAKDIENFKKKLNKLYKKYIKGKDFSINLMKYDLGEVKFYVDLTLATLLKIKNKKLKPESFLKMFRKLFNMYTFLNLYNEEINYGVNNNYEKDKNEKLSVFGQNKDSSSNNRVHDNICDCFVRLLENKIRLNKKDVDLVFLQVIFTIKNKDGKVSIKKYEIMKNGNPQDKIKLQENTLLKTLQSNYSATSVMVALPTAVVAQMLLDNKIKEKGIYIPKSPHILEKIFEELRKNNIYLTIRDEIVAKF